MKTAGSPGPDAITAKMLQEVAWEVSPALTILFRKSFSSSIVPHDWRCANITPIFKKGRKSDPSNYRPVSLTSICGKLMESHIKKELEDYLKTNHLILPTQHGFMKGKSCATNLLHTLEVLTKAVDNGQAADVVYLDFSKAFDKVPHTLLIGKLAALGINGRMLRWIKNWLSGRLQRVVIGGESSEWQEVKSGVPQGSLLGPVLFKVHINDIDLAVPDVTLIIKFADDTKAIQTIGGDEDRQRLQQALDNLMEWAAKWGMAFNTEKCKVVHVGRNNPQYPYKMGGSELASSDMEKDIGVLVNKTLKPSEQCSKAAKTANAVLGQIARGFHYRDRWTLPRLYKLYVRPHLEFASAAWRPWTQTDIQCLEKIQQRAIGMISGMGDKSYEERLQELGLTTLEDRREEIALVEMYKILHGFSDVDPGIWFRPHEAAENARATRLAADPWTVRVPAARLDLRKNFFTVRTSVRWNRLPLEVRASKSVNAFKNAYRRYVNTRAQ